MSSNRYDTHKVQSTQEGPTLPQIMREYGERYIRCYKPPLDHIKFIRSVRLCKSAGLGGKILECNKCHHLHYIYFSCGHSRCPCCQAIKREQWLDKTLQILLDVPYVHLVCTVPQELRVLNKRNPKEMYNLLFRATKRTVYKIMKDPTYVGGVPGMISPPIRFAVHSIRCHLGHRLCFTEIYHSYTFGSDMKYHVHSHTMLTYGGLDAEGKWVYPRHKKRICRNSHLRYTFREVYLAELKSLFDQKRLNHDKSYEETVSDIEDKNWTVFISHPTMTTAGITTYLSRYINRVAISESRLEYIKEARKVNVIYKDYRNQKEDQAAPLKDRLIEPLSFIHQLLQHLPPPYFHRTRRYGLHANAKSENTKAFIRKKVKDNGRTIRTVMEIIKSLMGLEVFACERCENTEFNTHLLKPDKTFIFQYITLPQIRSPSKQNA